mgnify:CR=1 FL=1
MWWVRSVLMKRLEGFFVWCMCISLFAVKVKKNKDRIVKHFHSSVDLIFKGDSIGNFCWKWTKSSRFSLFKYFVVSQMIDDFDDAHFFLLISHENVLVDEFLWTLYTFCLYRVVLPISSHIIFVNIISSLSTTESIFLKQPFSKCKMWKYYFFSSIFSHEGWP